MTQEDKNLLLTDLCARLPYGIKAYASEINKNGIVTDINIPHNMVNLTVDNTNERYELVSLLDIKPYLRSLSSMTEEEKEKYINLRYKIELGVNVDLSIYNYLNFLYSHHIDVDNRLLYRKLAIEAPIVMYI